MYIDYENDIKQDDENKIVRVKNNITNEPRLGTEFYYRRGEGELINAKVTDRPKYVMNISQLYPVTE